MMSELVSKGPVGNNLNNTYSADLKLTFKIILKEECSLLYNNI